MFYGLYDPDKRRSPTQKAASAAQRYRERFGQPAEVCLMSIEDCVNLATDPRGGLGVCYEGRAFIPRHVFYCGVEEDGA